MQPKKKSKKKRWIILGGVLVAVAVIAGGGFVLLRPRGIQAMALTGGEAITTKAEKGNIATTVVGTGTLATDDANDIKVPAGIKIKEVLVESGDKVKEGDILATLDEAALIEALASVQEQIKEIDEEINEVKDDTESSYIKTYVSGRVKKIYAEEEKAVNAVMNENGALILLSIDGKMAVQLSDVSGIAAGDTMKVTLSDGDTVEGTVDSLSGSECIITMTDNGTAYEEEVTVSTEDGTEIGSGQLYIHQQLAITGIGGTVYDIYVDENESVSAEESLIKLTDVPASIEYQKLTAQRSQLTEELQILTNLSAVNAITATFSGTIQSVNVSDDSTVEKSSSVSNNLSADADAVLTKQTLLTFTSTASQDSTADEKSTEKSTEATKVTAISIEEILEGLSITAPVKGAAADTALGLGGNGYTGSLSWYAGSDVIAAETVFQGSTQYSAVITLTATDGYEFTGVVGTKLTYDGTGSVVIDTNNKQQMQFTITFPATEAETESETAADNEDQKQTDQTPQTETPANNNKTTNSDSDKTAAATGSASSGMASAGSNSSGSSGGSAASDTTSSSSSDTSSTNDVTADYVTAFTISSDETMLLSVNIDELDILAVAKGQQAAVTLDALEGETFDGELTYLSDTASSSGGVTKYTAEITIPKTDSMLAGMNASATITIERKEDIIILPADAVQERGNRQFVYTEQDSEKSTLSGEVEVETGISDGSNVEIVSGLTEGQTVYYNKVISETTTQENGFMMGGGMMNGGMPSGEMPSRGNGGFGGERPSGAPSGQ